MAHTLNDTAYVAKRARERDFTVAQAALTVNEPDSILKTSPRKGNQGVHSTFLGLGFLGSARGQPAPASRG